LQICVTSFVIAAFLEFFEVLAQRFSRYGHCVEVEHVFDFLHNARHTARIINVLRGPPSGGTHIEQVVCAAVQSVKGIRVEFDSKLVSNCRNMQQRIC